VFYKTKSVHCRKREIKKKQKMLSPLHLIVALTCLTVFIIGMIGIHAYSEAKMPHKTSRLVFSSVVGFALGLAPVAFFIGNAVGNSLSGPIATRAMLGFFSLICLFAWIMCAVIVSDRDKIKLEKRTVKFVSTMMAITIVMWLMFGFLAYVGAPLSMSGMTQASGVMKTAMRQAMPTIRT
jgi:MFS family permease